MAVQPPAYPGPYGPPPPTARPRKPVATWVAFAAGVVAVVVSFSPWILVYGADFGPNHFNGAAGWATAALGALIAGSALLRRRRPGLPWAAALPAIAAGAALTVIGAWNFIADIKRIVDAFEEFAGSGSDSFSMTIGPGLPLIIVAGVVGAVFSALAARRPRPAARAPLSNPAPAVAPLPGPFPVQPGQQALRPAQPAQPAQPARPARPAPPAED